MNNLIKNNIKFVFGFVIGGIVFFCIGVFAIDSISSNTVYYDNTTGLESTNVQDALDEMHNLTSKGTATSETILSGYNALVLGKQVDGSMPNNGDLSMTLDPGGSYNIPSGYTSGGLIQVNPNLNTETYIASVNGNSIDMGVNNNYRYLDTTNIYNAGVSDADARVNEESQSYISGYSNGLSAGKIEVATSTQTKTCKITLSGVNRISCKLTFDFPNGVLGLAKGTNSWVGLGTISGNTVTVYHHSTSANNSGSFSFNVTAIGY